MKIHTVKEFVSQDGKGRVVILQREDGCFSFREDRRVVSSRTELRGPLWNPSPIFKTEEAAGKAARAAIGWLRDLG